jgi:flagellar basal-body rod protein FlgB
MDRPVAMDLANLPLFSAITRKMNWLSARQKLLANNVANVATPNFKALDLKPLDFKSALAQAQGQGQATLQLASTNSNHLAPPPPDLDTDDSVFKETKEHDINGNTVSIEDEMMKVSETTTDYELITNLYKKQIGLLKQAIGKGGGA